MITYKTYEDMANTIRLNLWKIPQDINCVIGIPRSGMFAALIVSELLNVKCMSIDDFVLGVNMSCGNSRSMFVRDNGTNKVLVLDDTCCGGGSMATAKVALQHLESEYQIIYGCVYLTGPTSKQFVDLYLENIYNSENFRLYEWNVFHHGFGGMQIWDIDGLMCKNPIPHDPTNEKLYEDYIANAIPMALPTVKIAGIVTYRLEKHRDITEKWLAKHNINYGTLVMMNAKNCEERRKIATPAQYKASVYNNSTNIMLFIESDDSQAREIFALTKKPVLSYSTGNLYQI